MGPVAECKSLLRQDLVSSERAYVERIGNFVNFIERMERRDTTFTNTIMNVRVTAHDSYFQSLQLHSTGNGPHWHVQHVQGHRPGAHPTARDIATSRQYA